MRPRALALLAFLHCGRAESVVIEPIPLPPADASVASIPNTSVEDVPENRAVIGFCERYRKAFEVKDIATIMSLVSPRFSQNDMDYEGVRRFLEATFAKAETIRYEIAYRHIRFAPSADGGRVFVDYAYSSTYKLDGQWKRHVDESQLVLEPKGDSFLILDGM